MADELKQPGVEVLQVFEEVTPAVVVPTLGACTIGVCKQIVELFEADGAGGTSINGDASITIPAFFDSIEASAWPAAAFDTRNLYFEVNNGPPVPVLFALPAGAVNLSAKKIVDIINDAFIAYNVYSAAYALVVQGSAGMQKVRVRTRMGGDLQSIRVSVQTVADRTVIAALGLQEGRTFVGLSSYTQKSVKVPTFAFPDPRGNLSSLVFDKGTIRAFMYMGSGLNMQEGFQDQALLRFGDHTITTPPPYFDLTDISVIDDGNGDTISPIVKLHGENLLVPSASLEVTGAAAPGPYALTGTSVAFDYGEGMQIYEFIEDPADMTAVAVLLNGIFGVAVGGKLIFTAVGAGTDELHIETTEKGVDAYLHIGDAGTIGTAHTALGLDDSALPVPILNNRKHQGDRQYTGVSGFPVCRPHPVKPGDLLYLGGQYAGAVVKVDPRGGFPDEVRLDRQHPITPTLYARTFFFVAKNLPPPDVLYDRPEPDAVVDENTGDLLIKGTLVRDTKGYASDPVSSRIYVTYEALRRDVSPAGMNSRMLQIDSTTQLDSLLAPVSPDNPLALGLRFALLNSSSARVYGVGVDAYSDIEPWGTTKAFEKVFSFLESKEVYAIAPLTDSKVVAELGNLHALYMSSPEMKGERICVMCLPRPTRNVDKVVASGTSGNSGNQPHPDTMFYTNVANLSLLLLEAGIDSTGVIPVEDGVFLEVEEDDYKYSVKSVSGGAVLVRQTAGEFAPGENDDGFYREIGFSTLPLVNSTFSLKVRGEELVDLNGEPDPSRIADAYQDIGRTFSSRRFWNLVLNRAFAVINGADMLISPVYTCAAFVGLISGQPPFQSFTNFPLTGFTRIEGTNTYFSARELNRIAAGGNTIIVQEPEDIGPIFPRMALTTDVTSVETRTDSITKCLDFYSKTLRTGLRNFIGKFNINQSYLDMLSTVVQGLIEFTIDNKIMTDASLNNLIQDEANPDTVMIDTTVDPPYPCNYIRVRIFV